MSQEGWGLRNHLATRDSSTEGTCVPFFYIYSQLRTW